MDITVTLNQIEVTATPTDIDVSVSPLVVTIEQSQTGPQGIPGPQGPPGASGSDIYDHTQSVASDTWTVNHNLGVKPDVEVRNSGGGVVGAEVLHVSDNITMIFFSSPRTGSAHFG